MSTTTVSFDAFEYMIGGSFASELHTAGFTADSDWDELRREASLSYSTESIGDTDAPVINFSHPSFIAGLRNGLAAEATRNGRIE